MHRIEKRYVFLFSAPQVLAWGPCFCSVGLFSSWLEWWLPLVEVFQGGLSVTFFGRWILPDSSALGAGLPGLLGSCSIELLPLSRSGCVQRTLPLLFITPFASLVFLDNCGFVGVDNDFGSWFWAGVHLWVVRSAQCPSSASSPSTLVASWNSGRGACLPFFPFSFSFGVFVTPGLMERVLEGAFPSGCSSFSFGVALPPH